MKILFFLSSLNAGGAERVATTLANAWADRGDAVTLVTTWRGQAASFYPLDARVRWFRLGAGRAGQCPQDAADRDPQAPDGPRGVPVAYRVPVLGKWRAIRHCVRDGQPDVVVSFLTNVNVNVLLATLGMDVPVIVCERTHPIHGRSAGRLLRLLRRALYPRAACVVLQTDDARQAMGTVLPRRARTAVIANPLPASLHGAADGSGAPSFDPAAAARTLSGGPGHATGGTGQLVAMGRLVPTKQFDLLIAAFAQLAAGFPGWTLTIWGEGPLRQALQAQIDGLGLQQQIRLAGRTAQPWQALAAGSVFAMTSRVEGFPNVMLEAMALGVPCIALDCPSGPRELSREGQDAWLVPLGDQQALVDALRQLLTDDDLRRAMGARARASVQARYGLGSVLADWDAVFEQAMDNRQHTRKRS